MSSSAFFLSALMTRVETLETQHGRQVGYIARLRRYLEHVQSLLRERSRNVDFNHKVIHIAYDIESALDRQLILEPSGPGGGSSTHAIHFDRCKAKIPLGNFIQNIEKKINILKSYPPTSVAVSEADTQFIPAGSRCRVCGQEDNLDPADIPGLGNQITGLWAGIRQIPHGMLKHIAITGLAGIGKTALAWKMFNDHAKAEKDKLDVYAWACWSPNSRDKDVLVSLLLDVDKTLSRDNLLGNGISQLKTLFKEKLLGKGFFIVLDGVPSTQLWDSISDTFPDDARSMVLITTRDEEFYDGFVKHTVPCLTRTDSEKLFVRRSEVEKPEIISKNASLKNTMNIILSMCQDIPREIIHVAGIFKGRKVEEWDEVLYEMLVNEKLETYILKTSISLSFDSLKPDWKPCFIYLAQFPPDKPIQLEKLYSMWIAEGLVPDKAHAEKCLKDLARRNLVMKNAGGKSCHLQEMSRKLSIFKGKEEGYFGISPATGTNGRTVNWGRAPVYSKDQLKQDNISVCFHDAKRTRTLIFSGDEGCRLQSFWPIMCAESKNFQSTRVLDFDGIDFGSTILLMSIDKLVHLRYLGFGGCCLEEFPLSGCSFPYLETLDLRARNKKRNKVVMPNVLWKMSNLKFLYLPVAFQCKNGERLRLDSLEKLEILENFHAGLCNVNDLLHFKALYIITIIADGENDKLEKMISKIDARNDRPHPRMEKLSLELKDFDCYTDERQKTLKKLLECHGIHNLYLEGYIKRMPGNMTIGHDFTDIVFDGTEIREDPMPTLGQLNHLKSLVLCNEAIKVESISCSGSCFPVLEHFQIINLPSLKTWVLDDPEAMQKLTFLTIKKCQYLRILPEYVQYLPTLCQLKIGSMPDEFKVHIRHNLGVQSEKVVDEQCTIFVILEDE